MSEAASSVLNQRWFSVALIVVVVFLLLLSQSWSTADQNDATPGKSGSAETLGIRSRARFGDRKDTKQRRPSLGALQQELQHEENQPTAVGRRSRKKSIRELLEIDQAESDDEKANARPETAEPETPQPATPQPTTPHPTTPRPTEVDIWKLLSRRRSRTERDAADLALGSDKRAAAAGSSPREADIGMEKDDETVSPPPTDDSHTDRRKRAHFDVGKNLLDTPKGNEDEDDATAAPMFKGRSAAELGGSSSSRGVLSDVEKSLLYNPQVLKDPCRSIPGDMDVSSLPIYLQSIGKGKPRQQGSGGGSKNNRRPAVGRPSTTTGSKTAPAAPPPEKSRPHITLAEVGEHFKWSAETLSRIEEKDYARAVAVALMKGETQPDADDIIPVFTVPLFMDGMELMQMLNGVDVPVRMFVFVWNGNDKLVGQVLSHLQLITTTTAKTQNNKDFLQERDEERSSGSSRLVVVHNEQNLGFSAAINVGIKLGRKVLGVRKATWTFACNADAVFRSGQLRQFAYYANIHWKDYGLFYGPRQDHFAFGISSSAVEMVGLMDEVFFPGYMEDIDYRWRVRLCGLGQIITGAGFAHKQSTSLKKRGEGAAVFHGQLDRSARGWDYGMMKWGKYGPGHIEDDAPPSGWTRPFNFPQPINLKLWLIDPEHRQCVVSGEGNYRPSSGTCWYNASVLTDILPPDLEMEGLPGQLLNPGVEWKSGAHRRPGNKAIETKLAADKNRAGRWARTRGEK